MKDAQGNELKIGDRVRHIHSPLGEREAAAGQGHRFHNFYGSSEIVKFCGSQSVQVVRTNPRHIPVHLACLVEKVSAA